MFRHIWTDYRPWDRKTGTLYVSSLGGPAFNERERTRNQYLIYDGSN